MIKNILTIIFMLLGIIYGFSNLVRLLYKQSISGPQICLMAIGIVGSFACLRMAWRKEI